MIYKVFYLILTYLIGSFPTGVYYSKLIHKTDVRTLGSGNSGGTNIGRNFGLKAAIIVIIIDALKGLVPFAIAKYFFSGEDGLIMLTGILSVIGHAYPIWANFKGGKVVATSIGVMLAFKPMLGICLVLSFLVLLFLTSMVSFSAMVSYFIATIVICITSSWIYGLGFTLISLFLIFRHHENIARLIKGKENRINWGLGKNK